VSNKTGTEKVEKNTA